MSTSRTVEDGARPGVGPETTGPHGAGTPAPADLEQTAGAQAQAAEGTDSVARQRSRSARPADQDVPYGVRLAAAWTWRVLLLIAGVAVVAKLSAGISTVLIAVAVAALISGLLSPVVMFLRRHKVAAGLATAIAELGLILVVLGLLALVGQQLISGFTQLSDQVVTGYHQLLTWAENGPLHLTVSQLNSSLDSLVTTLKNNSSSILSGAAAVGSTASSVAEGLVICLFTLIFFLLEGERIWLFLVRLVPQRARVAVNGAGRKGWNSMVSYVRVQVFVAFVDAVGISVGALVLQVPLFFPLGVLVFLSSFIPVVGALLSGAVAVLLALVANGPVNAVLMLLVVLLVQQAESHLLQPLVMGRAVSLHPLAVVLAVVVGSTVLGIVGALFAVPVMAVLNTVVRYIAQRQWEDDPGIRTVAFKYDWEIAKAEKKDAKHRERAARRSRAAQGKPARDSEADLDSTTVGSSS